MSFDENSTQLNILQETSQKCERQKCGMQDTGTGEYSQMYINKTWILQSQHDSTKNKFSRKSFWLCSSQENGNDTIPYIERSIYFNAESKSKFTLHNEPNHKGKSKSKPQNNESTVIGATWHK